MWRLAAVLIMLSPLVTRAAPPAPSVHDLIARADKELEGRDEAARIALIGTLAEIQRHIEQATEEDMQRISALQTLLALKLAETRMHADESAATEQKAPEPPKMLDAEQLYQRGADAEKIGDIVTAQRWYRTAANAGYGPAATAMGRTYDPAHLAELRVVGGIQPSIVDARRWYERAVALGEHEAVDLLAGLGK